MMTVCALAFVVGVWLLQSLPFLPSLLWLGLLFIPAITIGVADKLQIKPLKPAAPILLSAGLGFFWAAGYAHYRLHDELPHAWEGEKISLVGVVASMPQKLERGDRFEFDVEHVLTEGAQVPSHISLSQFNEQKFGDEQSTNIDSRQTSSNNKLAFHAGERWKLTVKLKQPHGTFNPHGFDFEAWALERNIRATGYIQKKADNQRLQSLVAKPSYLIELAREHVRDRMQIALPDSPYVGVLVALATGDENAISSPNWQLFQRTGTSHLMSISGLHITMLSGMVVALVYGIWRRIPSLVIRLPSRKAAVIAGVITALLYALFSGYSIPAQRTLYMLLVFAYALWAGRQISFVRVLAYALLVVVLLDPWAVLAAGFWLSFGAVAVMAYAFSGRLARPHWLKEAAYGQWAVTLGTLPLLLILFQQVSIISPVANSVAIPLVSLLVVPLTLLGGLLSIDSVLHLAHTVMSDCMHFLVWLADFPYANWQQHAPPVWTLLIALIGVFWMLLPRGFPLRWVGLLALLPMFLSAPALLENGAMQVSVLDVGQGLSVVVNTRHHHLLYDTGPRYSTQSDSGSRIVLPYLRGQGISRLNGLIVSHNDTDHSGGMDSILAQMPVKWVASSLPLNAPSLINQHAINCFSGQSWVWDDVSFEMLYPIKESYADAMVKDNDRSCVLKVTSHFGSLLLTGDVERNAEKILLDAVGNRLSSDVLVVPHHGSKTSSTLPFVEAVHPGIAIFTVGYRNRFGHPKPLIEERYKDIGSQTYRSDRDGALMLDFVSANGIDIRAWRHQYRRYWHDGNEL